MPAFQPENFHFLATTCPTLGSSNTVNSPVDSKTQAAGNQMTANQGQTITNPEWENSTAIKEFILLGFQTSQELQILLFMVFLTIYTMTLVANLLIIYLVVVSQHLHNPMYFFLGNLSFLETCISSTILPRLLANFVTENHQVSVGGCIVQLWVFANFAVTECYLLAAMSYDRYLAVCRPLHYNSHMNFKVCLQLAAGSWISSFVQNVIFFSFMFQLTFCGQNVIDHFFCDIIPIIERTCNNSQQIKLLSASLSFLCTLPPFILNIASYGCIMTAIFEISSNTGRKKAFSVCSSHLVVVTIFYGSLIIVYILPKPNRLKEISKIFSVFYTVLTPLINPLVYTLRNKDVKEALRRTTSKCAFYVRLH